MTVRIKADALDAILSQMNSREIQKQIGDEVVSQIKESLDAGVSPVKGERRFENYKDPKKYPGDKKSRLPVNLKLTGAMLDALEYRTSGGKLTVGIFDAEQAAKAKAHNDGISPQPRRHFLPTDNNDELNISITRAVKNLYADIIADIIKKNSR